MPTRIPTHAIQLFIFIILIKRHFFCWFTFSLSALSVLRLKKEEEEERERPFLFTSFSRRRDHEKLNKGREFREAVSCGLKIGNNGTDRSVGVFFSRPALKINARGGRETEKLTIVPLK